MSGPLGKAADELLMARFRAKLAQELELGASSSAPDNARPVVFPAGYAGLIGMIRQMHGRAPDQAAAAAASRRTLRSLFPNWPPGAPAGDVGLLWWFGVLFAKPFPAFSARLNAWVTWWAAQWLMGPCVLEDLPPSALGPGGRHQRLLVKRCRYLEEAACASVCVGTCKLPTQQFFNGDMAVPMRMLPNYETYECVFEFGNAPTAEDEAEAAAVSCFAACPSQGADRQRKKCMEPRALAEHKLQ